MSDNRVRRSGVARNEIGVATRTERESIGRRRRKTNAINGTKKIDESAVDD
jgi:hypothetical protein